MTQALHLLRVRGHVPATGRNAETDRRAARHRPRAGDVALLIHVAADDQDRLLIATACEVMLTDTGAIPVGERIYAPPTRLNAIREQADGLRPVVPPGCGSRPISVQDVAALGTRIASLSYKQRWPIVGDNLRWALGRLSASAGPNKKWDGFSLSLAGCGAIGKTGDYRHSWYKPRLIVPFAGGGIFDWTHPYEKEDRYRGKKRARFVDLGTAANAVSGSEFDCPESAAGYFDVGWPEPQDGVLAQLRAEAKALIDLYGRLTWELADAAPGLPLAECYSFGSIATHLLDKAGVQAPLRKAAHVPAADLGAAASSMFGGRFEAPIVGVPMPMELRDIRSTYAAIGALLNIGAVYACRQLDSIALDTAQIRHVLQQAADDHPRMWSPELWRQLGLTFITIRPHGEVLPSTSQSRRGRWRTTVAPLDLAGGEATFHWCDIAAAVAAGAVPADMDIVRSFRLRPQGIQPGLRPLRLPTGRMVDLATDDLAAVTVHERHAALVARSRRAGLVKAVGNAHMFGNLARHDRKTTSGAVETAAVGPAGERLTRRTRHPERPGPHAFLPAAAAVCAGARFALALARRNIVAAGSDIAAMHADSIAVPCSADGGRALCPEAADGTLRVIPREELDQLLGRFGSLGINFKTEIGTSVQGTVGLVIGVNKVLYADKTPTGGYRLVRSSDSGLGGHLADPSNAPGARLPDGRWMWAAACEHAILTPAIASSDIHRPPSLAAALNAAVLPEWTDRPVARRYQANSWQALKALRLQANDPGIMPFARYLRVDTGSRSGGPIALGAWPDARSWKQAEWRSAGQSVALLTLDDEGSPRLFAGTGRRHIVVKTLAEYLGNWARADVDGGTGPQQGLVQIKTVRSAPGLISVTGKDGAELDASDEDPAHVDPESVRLDYGTVDGSQLRERVKELGQRAVGRHAGLPYATVHDWTRGGSTSPDTLAGIVAAVETLERAAKAATRRVCARPGCGKPAEVKWCSGTCRMAVKRAADVAEAPDPGAPDRLPSCPACGTQFVNPIAEARHECPKGQL